MSVGYPRTEKYTETELAPTSKGRPLDSEHQENGSAVKMTMCFGRFRKLHSTAQPPQSCEAPVEAVQLVKARQSFPKHIATFMALHSKTDFPDEASSETVQRIDTKPSRDGAAPRRRHKDNVECRMAKRPGGERGDRGLEGGSKATPTSFIGCKPNTPQ